MPTAKDQGRPPRSCLCRANLISATKNGQAVGDAKSTRRCAPATKGHSTSASTVGPADSFVASLVPRKGLPRPILQAELHQNIQKMAATTYEVEYSVSDSLGRRGMTSPSATLCMSSALRPSRISALATWSFSRVCSSPHPKLLQYGPRRWPRVTFRFRVVTSLLIYMCRPASTTVLRLSAYEPFYPSHMNHGSKRLSQPLCCSTCLRCGREHLPRSGDLALID
jgi:hypothetical protein